MITAVGAYTRTFTHQTRVQILAAKLTTVYQLNAVEYYYYYYYLCYNVIALAALPQKIFLEFCVFVH